MINAIRPPTRKNPNEVTKYISPMTFGSVVVTIVCRNDPLRAPRGG